MMWMGLGGVVGDWEYSTESGEAAVMTNGVIAAIGRWRKKSDE